jgi:branched-chain amino acid aminotransferase group I
MDPKLPNPKNNDIKVYINGQFYAREDAKVSVFDSVVQGGDSVWEGLRVYDGKVFMLDEHLERLVNSAKAMAFSGTPSKEEVKKAVVETLKVNGMMNDAHIRLTLTRGKKITSGMNPKLNQYGPTLIVLAEWKAPIYTTEQGLTLITSSIRRNSPQCLDSKIHHNNLINNILAKIEANHANCDGAVMLDLNGFVSETNTTNIFFIKKGELITPFADFCLPGITRALMLELADRNGVKWKEKNITIAEMYTMDEMFTTGTEGGLAAAVEVDGRLIGDGKVGPVTKQFQKWHEEETKKRGVPIV